MLLCSQKEEVELNDVALPSGVATSSSHPNPGVALDSDRFLSLSSLSHAGD